VGAMVKRKIPSPRRKSNPRTPTVQPVAHRDVSLCPCHGHYDMFLSFTYKIGKVDWNCIIILKHIYIYIYIYLMNLIGCDEIFQTFYKALIRSILSTWYVSMAWYLVKHL
jgi:hypothetical protein